MLNKRRAILQGLVVFFAVLTFGFFGPSRMSETVIDWVAESSNWMLQSIWSETRAFVEVQPAPLDAVRQSSDQIQTDTWLKLGVQGAAPAVLGLSLRRDVYLPWVLFTAWILAAPLPIRRRGLGLLLGSVAIWLVGVCSVLWLVDYVVATELPQVYDSSQSSQRALKYLFDCWLTPPGNRAIAPTLLAAVWVVLAWPRSERVLNGVP